MPSLPTLLAALATAWLGSLQAAVPLIDAANIATGEAHACAITRGGAVKCWGANGAGQLGNGTTTEARTAVGVAGLDEGAVAIAAGSWHTCAITRTGGVKCWGANAYGQLGDGTTANALVATAVVGLSTEAMAIAAGFDHTCLVTAVGAVKCWGGNDYGQLGDGTTTPSTVPVDVVGLASGVVSVTAGGSSSFYYAAHTCGLTAAGAVKCWGFNNLGQLGNGTTIASSTPVDVDGLAAGVTGIAAGMGHTCAAMALGGVRCWGNNLRGQLGNGTTVGQLTPVDVVGLASGFAAIAAGQFRSCALEPTGAAKCWGAGSLGDGSMQSSLTPVAVSVVAESIGAIATGAGHTCALAKVGGGAKCWGDNQSGQLGNGIAVDFPDPVDTLGLQAGAVAATAGAGYSCAQTSTEGLQCWGTNDAGQLGNGTRQATFTPVKVAGTGSTVIASKGWLGAHTCGLTAAGGVQCWGRNSYGQLGDGTTVDATAPVAVVGLANGVVAVAPGQEHSCALTTGGGVKCWGRGYLGNGTTGGSLTPTDVTGLAGGVSDIAAGAAHTCAVATGGAVKCWGYNAYGQLGDGTMATALTPVTAVGLGSGIVALAAGYDHTCALTATGGVKCWGSNTWGQLGDGTMTRRLTAVNVAGLASSVAAITAGGAVEWIGQSHTCARIGGGGVKCWGGNDHGQLGDGSKVDASLPVDVAGLPAAAAVSAGTDHTCATTVAGAVKCWGANTTGQLGNGVAGYFAFAQDVLVASCGAFADVSPDSPFCPNVEWLRNRGVTLGCTSANTYCPSAPVSRLGMAAFMNRLGTALTGVLAARKAASGALDPDASPIACATDEWTAIGYPRRAYGDGVLNVIGTGDTTVGAELVASLDGGVGWSALSARPSALSVRAGRWMGQRTIGDLDLAVGTTVRFGLRVSRVGAPGGATISDSSCNLRVRIDNRNGDASPFDTTN